MFNIDDCNWWMVFYEEVDEETFLHHVIGYEIFPDQINIDLAITEVKDDLEFGLGDKIYDLKYMILDKDKGREIAQYLMEDDD